MLLQFERFRGELPAVAEQLLDPSNAEVAQDCYLVNGNLKPFPSASNHNDVGFPPAGALTLSRYNHNQWLFWSSDVDVVRTPNVTLLGNNERIYFTGLDVFRVADAGTINSNLDGVTGYKVGVPPFALAPSVAISVLEPNAASRSYDPLDKVTRYYAITTVNQWGEESAFSPLPGFLNVYSDSHVTITFPALPDFTGYVPVDKIRIYRSNTGTSETDWQYVAEVPSATATYLDTLPDDRLGVVAETQYWALPPSTLKNVVVMENGCMAAIDGREVCFTPEYVPYAWPGNFRYTIPDNPVALVALGSSVVVLTESEPYLLAGGTPDVMQRIQLRAHQSCLSKKAVTKYLGQAVYASPDGLIAVTAQGEVTNLTEELFPREDWLALNPQDMTFAVHDNRIYGFAANNGFVLDPVRGNLVRLSFGAVDLYTDFKDDVLYAYDGANLLGIANGNGDLPYTWESRIYFLSGRHFAAAQVQAKDYASLTFEFLLDGVVVHTQAVTSRTPFRLPAKRGRVLAFRVTGTSEIEQVRISTSMTELR